MKSAITTLGLLIAFFTAMIFLVYWTVVFMANLIGLIGSVINYFSIVWSERNESHP